MAIITKRTIMSLYSNHDDIYSHQVRIVLAEKGVNVEIMPAKTDAPPSDLLAVNPYGTLPTLIDRELVLYEARIIMEYLDERFPHPPLMPVYPVARAKARLIIHRFDREWGPLIRKLETGKAVETRAATKELTGYLVQLVPLFNSSIYFLGDDFTLVDCCIAPVLWRLSAWNIALSPAETKALNKYANRIFQRDSFQASLTEAERELKKLVVAKAEIA